MLSKSYFWSFWHGFACYFEKIDEGTCTTNSYALKIIRLHFVTKIVRCLENNPKLREYFKIKLIILIVMWHDTWKPELFIARQRLVKHIPVEADARNDRRAVFSVVRVALVATQRCGKHIFAAVNQHATIKEAVFSVGAAPRLYNGGLTQNRVTLFLGDINTGTWPSRLGGSRIWESKMWSWVPRDSDLRMTALARTNSNCKRQTHQTHPLVREDVTEVLLLQVFSWTIKLLCLESQGASRQDELIGAKPPVIK
jgi:hypothetical protein